MKWKKLYLLKKEFVTAKHYIKHCQIYSELVYARKYDKCRSVNTLSAKTKIDRKTVKTILSNLGSLVSLTGNSWTVKIKPEEGTVNLWTDKAGQRRPQYTKLYVLQGLTQNQSIIFSVIKSIGKYRKVNNS